MRAAGLALIVVFLSSAHTAQSALQPIYDAQKAFERTVAEKGMRTGYLEFLSDDAVIFRPEAVNGRDFLKTAESPAGGVLRRSVSFADISTNELLGYTTGEWTLVPQGKPGIPPRVGQYATVWSKGLDGKYKAILDIEISHDPYEKKQRRGALPTGKGKDVNKKGWSAADTVMNFLKMGMTKAGLGGAYDKFAADNVRLFREGMPPIEGRKAAENEMEKYIAVDFPKRVAQFESADMAYSWNPCSYATSNEGMEKGNCLHIWKFRDEKWRIVLGVFARVANNVKPVLREKQRPARK